MHRNDFEVRDDLPEKQLKCTKKSKNIIMLLPIGIKQNVE